MDRLQSAGRWLWRQSRPYFREAYLRASQASKTELASDVLNFAALTYQLVITTVIAWSRPGAAVLIGAVIYSTAHRLFAKRLFKSRKWATEEQRRAQAIAVAATQLALAVAARRVPTAEELYHVERALLSAMLSEVEALVVDTEGIYLNVNLIVEDRRDPNRLLCLNRANPYREPHRTYPKEGMIPWNAMTTQRTIHVPRFEPPDPDAPYRSVIALPLLLPEPDGTKRALGSISIDSSRPDHFEALDARIAAKLLPYVTLVTLVLVYRGQYDAWPTRHDAQPHGPPGAPGTAVAE